MGLLRSRPGHICWVFTDYRGVVAIEPVVLMTVIQAYTLDFGLELYTLPQSLHWVLCEH